MGPIHNIKGVQQVIGCLAVLNHFISCLGERGLPLYQLLKKVDHFEWMSEAQEALDMVKLLLTRPPILVPPRDGESLLLYIAATTQVVSAALVVEPNFLLFGRFLKKIYVWLHGRLKLIFGP